MGSPIRALTGLLLFVFALAAAADGLTDRARRLLEARQAREAYELLLPLESQRAGDPEYDYLLGIAALDAGEPERAVFALERVLAVQPDNALARAEIARAYFVLGERETARREFQTVRAQPIPADAKETVERFLSAIAAAETTRLEGFFELGIGADSNVNSATSSTQVFVPALPLIGPTVLQLDSASTRRHDTLTSVSTGLNFTRKLSEDWSLVGAAAGAWRLNHDEDRFDTATADASLGARWARGKEAFTLGGQLQDFEINSTRFRETRGLVAQWQHSYDERRQATLYGQHAQLRYPTQTVRNADRDIVGVAYAQAFAGTYSPMLFASAYGGREKERMDGVPYLGHEPWGLRLGGQLRLGGGWSAFGTAICEERRYGGPQPSFLITRKDRQADLNAGVSYLFRPGTTFIAQVAHTDNRSNFELARFRRTVGTLSIRFTF